MDVYVCVLVWLREGKERKEEEEKKEERERRLLGSEGTGNEKGNRKIEKKIKEKEKQRRIGIDFGH